MPPEVLQQYRENDIKLLVTSIRMILHNLDRLRENENLEILSQIEMEIEKLPIDEFVKPRLCDILWSPQLSLEISLRTVAQLLSDPRYTN